MIAYGLTSGDTCDIRMDRGSGSYELRGLRFKESHKQGGVLTFDSSDGLVIVPISAIVYITVRKP